MRKITLFWWLCAGLPAGGYAQHTVTIKHTYYTNTFDTVQCSEIQGFYVQTKANATNPQRFTRSSFTADPDQPAACKLKYPSSYSTYNAQFATDDAQDRMDKGHVNPYSAMEFNETAALESMYYSNVCPQVKYFNEHQWERVEQYVLKTVSPQYGDVQVWTGVLVSTAHPRKAGQLYIPDYYWKVISYTKNGSAVQEAWLGPNKPTNKSTDPTVISTTVADVKRVIKQYYPKFEFAF
ncbi:MAG TPA: DNA/RNA non-specific endonuclease [Puia sp.]|jgi:DNA/RNA endonuclease G (NUC1)|nr:DNA/RNA non-specific endonuclease [Puia sp.]